MVWSMIGRLVTCYARLALVTVASNPFFLLSEMGRARLIDGYPIYYRETKREEQLKQQSFRSPTTHRHHQ